GASGPLHAPRAKHGRPRPWAALPGIRGRPRPAVENIGVLADAPTYHYRSPPPRAPGACSEMATSPPGSLIRLIGPRGLPSLRAPGHPAGVDAAGTPAAASIRRDERPLHGAGRNSRSTTTHRPGTSAPWTVSFQTSTRSSSRLTGSAMPIGALFSRDSSTP